MTTITPPPRPTHPFFAALNYRPAPWEEKALCRRFPEESDAWTSGKEGGAGAIEICWRCPVRLDCLSSAIRQEGTENLARIATIRGGLRPDERADLALKARSVKEVAA